jgi:hypothetical protein
MAFLGNGVAIFDIGVILHYNTKQQTPLPGLIPGKDGTQK